jgi:hypothetical protein
LHKAAATATIEGNTLSRDRESPLNHQLEYLPFLSQNELKRIIARSFEFVCACKSGFHNDSTFRSVPMPHLPKSSNIFPSSSILLLFARALTHSLDAHKHLWVDGDGGREHFTCGLTTALAVNTTRGWTAAEAENTTLPAAAELSFCFLLASLRCRHLD